MSQTGTTEVFLFALPRVPETFWPSSKDLIATASRMPFLAIPKCLCAIPGDRSEFTWDGRWDMHPNAALLPCRARFRDTIPRASELQLESNNVLLAILLCLFDSANVLGKRAGGPRLAQQSRCGDNGEIHPGSAPGLTEQARSRLFQLLLPLTTSLGKQKYCGRQPMNGGDASANPVTHRMDSGKPPLPPSQNCQWVTDMALAPNPASASNPDSANFVRITDDTAVSDYYPMQGKRVARLDSLSVACSSACPDFQGRREHGRAGRH